MCTFAPQISMNMQESKSIIEVNGVSKFFGEKTALDHVTLNVKKGEFVTILGPSGCGKTTLLRLIAGFQTASEGEIKISGKEITQTPPHKRPVNTVFQKYALFPHLNVYDNIAFGLKLKKMPKQTIEKKVKAALKMVGMTDYEYRDVDSLSGGQQQRVAVARALVMNPELLLLDEPLSNLDAKLRESVRVELREIQQKMGLSTIYVTHDQSEALSMSDAIVVLKDGVVHQVGTPQEIYFEPKTPFVADFIGTTNLIPLKVEDGNTLSYGSKTFHSTKAVEKGRDYVASIRPESAKLSKTAEEGKVSVEAVIMNRMFLGEKVRYFVKDRLDKEWIVDMFDPGKTILQGDVYVTFPAEKAWVIEK